MMTNNYNTYREDPFFYEEQEEWNKIKLDIMDEMREIVNHYQAENR